MSPPATSSAPRPTSAARKPVVGFLVDRIDDSYQNELLSALVAASRRLGVTLLCFAGGSPRTEGPREDPRSRLYDLVGPENVDAVILSSATLETGLGAERLEDFVRRFGDLPTVSLGVPIRGVSSVVLDNTAGMRSLVAHMIDVHKSESIAFLRGPTTNDEAEARYRGYLDALRASRVGPNPDLIVEGDFLPDSGRKAVETLLDQRGARFDALVAANDGMALAALRELARRGIRVPEQVRVAGFDDETPSRYAKPALTTVRQPVAAIAEHAVRLALSRIRGAEPEAVALGTEFVRRRSCGCPLNEEELLVEAPVRPRKGEEESALVHKKSELVKDMVAASDALLDLDRAGKLVDVFIAQLRGKQKTSFVALWDELLAHVSGQGVDLRKLQPVVNALRHGAIPTLVDLQGMLLRAETMLHEARVLLATQIHDQEAQRRLVQERETLALCHVAQSLIVSFDMSSLVRAVARTLPELDIPSGFIALGELGPDSVYPQVQRKLRLILAHQGSQPPPAAPLDESYAAKELLPHGRLRPDTERAYVLQPLYFGDRPLGMAVFEMGPQNGALYEALRAQISAALEALILDADQLEKQEARKRLLEKTVAQAAALRQAYGDSRAAASGGAAAEKGTDEALALAIERLSALVSEWTRLGDVEQETLRPPGEAGREK